MDNSNAWIDAKNPPKAKQGWNHTVQCLLWYEGGEDKVSKFGVGYYHYDPPYGDAQWIDFNNLNRVPSFYQILPDPPTKH